MTPYVYYTEEEKRERKKTEVHIGGVTPVTAKIGNIKNTNTSFRLRQRCDARRQRGMI